MAQNSTAKSVAALSIQHPMLWVSWFCSGAFPTTFTY